MKWSVTVVPMLWWCLFSVLSYPIEEEAKTDRCGMSANLWLYYEIEQTKLSFSLTPSLSLFLSLSLSLSYLVSLLRRAKQRVKQKCSYEFDWVSSKVSNYSNGSFSSSIVFSSSCWSPPSLLVIIGQRKNLVPKKYINVQSVWVHLIKSHHIYHFLWFLFCQLFFCIHLKTLSLSLTCLMICYTFFFANWFQLCTKRR